MKKDMETILVKSRLFALLSLGFSYPTKDKHHQFAQGLFKASVVEAVAGLPLIFPGAAEEQVEGLETVTPSLEDFESRYINTFELGPPSPPCPIVERAYKEGGEPANLLFEVTQFYRHFGLEAGQDKGLAPDHITVELDFVHFLLFKEAQAVDEGSDRQPYQRAQKDFLHRHLSWWLPTMAKRMEEDATAAPPFYRTLARLAARLCTAELDCIVAESK